MGEIVKYTIEYYIDKYEAAIGALSAYLPWLEQHKEQSVAQDYKDSASTMAFPVYDSTLLAFVKQAQNTGLLDRNCVYLFNKRNIYNTQDELRFIETAQLPDMDDLWNLLSYYVLEGMTVGTKWSEGVTNGIFFEVITKMQGLMQAWGKEAVDNR